jgi:UDP-glucose 4-epimerase
MEFKKIIILGNSGFIGRYLEDHLTRQLPSVEIKGYSSIDIDLTKKDETEKLAGELDMQTVLVMCSMVKKEFGDNLDSYVKNLAMAVNLCRVLEKVPVKRFVYLSSCAVYGEDVENTHITEQTAVRPTSYYGMAKYASENLFQKILSLHKDSQLLILRPPLVYGAADRSQAYGPAGFIKKAQAREQIVLWGDGTESREFLYIDDLLNVMLKMVPGEYTGTVNVVSGNRYSFRDILDIIEERLETRLIIETRARTKTKADHGFNNALIKKLLPGITFTPLKEGVLNTMRLESGLPV